MEQREVKDACEYLYQLIHRSRGHGQGLHPDQLPSADSLSGRPILCLPTYHCYRYCTSKTGRADGIPPLPFLSKWAQNALSSSARGPFLSAILLPSLCYSVQALPQSVFIYSLPQDSSLVQNFHLASLMALRWSQINFLFCSGLFDLNTTDLDIIWRWILRLIHGFWLVCTCIVFFWYTVLCTLTDEITVKLWLIRLGQLQYP